MNLAKSIIGMIHVQALPGTPQNKYSISQICDMAVEEAKMYTEAGLDAIMIENMHDIPYLKGNVGPEITASMTAVARAVREATDLDLGIQILAGANKEALAVAQAANFQFIRAEGFVFGHMADEGLMESCAGELLRYRKAIGAEEIEVYTDIKKKHSSHAITADVDIDETALAAEFFLSDGLIVTGSSTGKAVYLHELKKFEGQGQPASNHWFRNYRRKSKRVLGLCECFYSRFPLQRRRLLEESDFEGEVGGFYGCCLMN